jgi:histidyl-tRNA synthetase
VPTCVLVAVDAEETRARPWTRSRPGCAPAASRCEVAPKADKFGKQIRYADRRGIPYVWFSDGSVKDIRSGEQAPPTPTPGCRRHPVVGIARA